MSTEAVVAHVVGVIGLIMLASSVLGSVVARFKQPTVIGQILTGILLGPTLLGRLPYGVADRLFPDEILPYLSVLAQVAVVIFMFVVGYEIDFRVLRGHSGAVSLVVCGCLLVPMALGAGAVLMLPSAFTALGEDGTGSRSFVLFLAVAVSVTALPVLAAIVRERGIAGTVPGQLAMTAAGIMDLVVWVALAAAVAGSSHTAGRPVWLTALLAAALILGLAGVVRPALRWWTERSSARLLDQVPLAVVLMTGCAWATSSLGLHTVFGGFLAGLVMPRPGGYQDADLLKSMEGASRVLLPLFFVVTGLSLDIAALGGAGLAVLGLILCIAVVGKAVPAYASARLARLGRQDSATVAVLLNTRGLTELIALDVGLTAGIIHQRLFVVLVLMALITTAMTGPLLSLLDGRRRAGHGGTTGAGPTSAEQPRWSEETDVIHRPT
ncbi:cation:proton antiporter [Streptomyces caelestis]|jgi:Kef-type K+ transport system membrane component KefB|uniref:cation:proton antiporter n=1 Tax=Streptomyces caelestis TaxID=36816 RepID=UPI00370000A8